jgi:hypothetical protein
MAEIHDVHFEAKAALSVVCVGRLELHCADRKDVATGIEMSKGEIAGRYSTVFLFGQFHYRIFSQRRYPSCLHPTSFQFHADRSRGSIDVSCRQPEGGLSARRNDVVRVRNIGISVESKLVDLTVHARLVRVYQGCRKGREEHGKPSQIESTY